LSGLASSPFLRAIGREGKEKPPPGGAAVRFRGPQPYTNRSCETTNMYRTGASNGSDHSEIVYFAKTVNMPKAVCANY